MTYTGYFGRNYGVTCTFIQNYRWRAPAQNLSLWGVVHTLCRCHGRCRTIWPSATWERSVRITCRCMVRKGRGNRALQVSWGRGTLSSTGHASNWGTNGPTNLLYNFIQFQMRTHPIFWTENFETYRPICTQFLLPCSITCSFCRGRSFCLRTVQIEHHVCLIWRQLVFFFNARFTVLQIRTGRTGRLSWHIPSWSKPHRAWRPGKSSVCLETESNWIQLIPGFKMANNTRRGPPWAVSRKTSWLWADCAGSWQLYTLARMVVGPWCRVQSSFLSSLPIHHECCVGVSENGDTHKRLF